MYRGGHKMLRQQTDLRGGGMQVGQPHVRRVLRRRKFVHGRNETVRFLVHVLQEADDADLGLHAHCELRLRVPVVLRAVLFLLQEHKRSHVNRAAAVSKTSTSCCGVKNPPKKPPKKQTEASRLRGVRVVLVLVIDGY